MGVIPIFVLCPAELRNFTARLVTLQSESASVRLHSLLLLHDCVRVTEYTHGNFNTHTRKYRGHGQWQLILLMRSVMYKLLPQHQIQLLNWTTAD